MQPTGESHLVTSRDAAQRRADQIAAFRAEVEQLRREGVLSLEAADLQRISAHQNGVLTALAAQFDIDRTTAARRMSRGMQIASLLGAAALVAAIVSFFYRIWGALGTLAQVALATAAPLVSVLVMIVAGRIEKTRYVASLFAIVACGAFVLQTVLLGQIFNLRGSPHVVAAWALFGIAVAWPWRFGVPFAAGAMSLAAYVPALLLWLNGYSWVSVPARPELLGAAALLGVIAVSRVPRELAAWGRPALLLVVLGVLLALTFGADSVFTDRDALVEGAYQILSAATTVALIWFGLRRGLEDLVVLGSLFGGVFLLTRFVDWWWDWMPKYLFFLIIAAVALGWLWGLRVARRRVAGAQA
jgi:hypothetical protein